jgi:hypothetical protein
MSFDLLLTTYDTQLLTIRSKYNSKADYGQEDSRLAVQCKYDDTRWWAGRAMVRNFDT